jgi:hypothetical protein
MIDDEAATHTHTFTSQTHTVLHLHISNTVLQNNVSVDRDVRRVITFLCGISEVRYPLPACEYLLWNFNDKYLMKCGNVLH